MRTHRVAWVFLAFCVGCGSGSPFSYIPVEGVLTYEDGSPIPRGGIKLKFFAQDAPEIEGASPRPAIAHVDSKGKFDCVTSYKYGDGLVPGKHKVAILDAKDAQGNALVPEEYSSASRTPLIVDTDEVPMEIKVPRP